MSSAADSRLVSANAGEGNATVTYGSVGLVHSTCAYCGPLGAGSFGISGGAAVPAFQPPQYFSMSASTRSGATSPATITVVYCGRYQRAKNTFEYSYWFGMFSMSA